MQNMSYQSQEQEWTLGSSAQETFPNCCYYSVHCWLQLIQGKCLEGSLKKKLFFWLIRKINQKPFFFSLGFNLWISEGFNNSILLHSLKKALEKNYISMPNLLFKIFFDVDYFLKSLLNLLQYCFCCLCSGFVAGRHVTTCCYHMLPHATTCYHMHVTTCCQNRDWTCNPCIGRWSLNHWITREVCPWLILKLNHL